MIKLVFSFSIFLLRVQGWDKKPGVTILFGRWQDMQFEFNVYDAIFFDTYAEYHSNLKEFHDVVGNHLKNDGIFFDTFGEYYSDLKQFQEEAMVYLLKPEGVYSFFNGLSATNSFFS